MNQRKKADQQDSLLSRDRIEVKKNLGVASLVLKSGVIWIQVRRWSHDTTWLTSITRFSTETMDGYWVLITLTTSIIGTAWGRSKLLIFTAMRQPSSGSKRNGEKLWLCVRKRIGDDKT